MINGLSTLLWRNCPQSCTPVLHSLFSRTAVFGRPGARLTFLPQPRGLCLDRLGSPRQNENIEGWTPNPRLQSQPPRGVAAQTILSSQLRNRGDCRTVHAATTVK